MLIGADGGTLRDPLNSARLDTIDELRAFDVNDVSVDRTYNDPTQRNYGQPEVYRLSVRGAGSQVLVHESRLIPVPGEPLPAAMRRDSIPWRGRSAASRPFARIRDYTEAVALAREILRRKQQGVYKMVGLSDTTPFSATLPELFVSMAQMVCRFGPANHVFESMTMNVIDAAYDTVHEYPGGAGPLASRLTRLNKDGERASMSEAVLNSKVNPNTSSHHLTLAEADRIMGITGDYRILHALAYTHGFVALRIEAPQAGSVTGAMFAAVAAKGNLAERIAKAMADNHITNNESEEISRAVMQVIAAVAEISERAQAATVRGGA